jgi:hypothetical protein
MKNMTISLAIAAALGASVGVVNIAHAAEPTQAALMAQATITQAAAEKTALAKVPMGTVKSAELENERGALVWSFDIATPKSRNIHEILVNAKTGKIIHTELETPKAQAKENAQDKADMKKAAMEKNEKGEMENGKMETGEKEEAETKKK